ncbi:MAG: polyprenyl synthetase family protein [Candidatus Omnitrophota bacterium]
MFDNTIGKINISLKDFVEGASGRIGLQKASPALYSGILEFVTRPGKRIRPVLFLISFKGYSESRTKVTRGLIRCSLAFELLHDFLLVHDDVIDNSSLRRGKPTLHKVFNKKLGVPGGSRIGSDLAIVAGDIIAALSVEALLSFNAPAELKEKALLEFTKAMSITGVGEFIDIVNNLTCMEKVKKNDVLMTYIYKTARYTFEAPLVIGAILSGCARSEIKKLSVLGTTLGQAFQLQDDMLDVFFSAKKTGKPVLSDIAESKKTLMAWKAYENLNLSGKKRASAILAKKDKTPSDIEEFRSLIISSGSGKYCLDLALSLLNASRSLIPALKMGASSKKALSDFVERSFCKINSLGDVL